MAFARSAALLLRQSSPLLGTSGMNTLNAANLSSSMRSSPKRSLLSATLSTSLLPIACPSAAAFSTLSPFSISSSSSSPSLTLYSPRLLTFSRHVYSTDTSEATSEAPAAAPVAEPSTAAADAAKKSSAAKKTEKAAKKAAEKEKKKTKDSGKPKKPQRMNFSRPLTPPGLPRELAYELPPKITIKHAISKQEWADDLNNTVGLRFPVRPVPLDLLTPSGWSKPMGPDASLPFAVVRSEFNNLPLYHQIKNGRTRIVTVLRHCRGDIPALLEDLRKVVNHAAALKYAHKTSFEKPEIKQRVGGLIYIQGDYVKPVAQWLKGLGF